MAIFRKSALSTLPAWSQLSEALERAEQRLSDWLLDPQRVQGLLAQVFTSPPTPAWQGLRQTLLAGRLQLDLQIREDWQMPGLAGAFQAPAPARPQGLILLNRRWLSSASPAAVEAVLLEELGHAIDQQLHGAVDTAGDEGERFSALLRGQQPAATSLREDDSRELLIDGQRLRVEGSGNAAVALPSVSLSLTTSTGASAPQRTAFGASTIRLDANLSLGSLTGMPTRMLVHFARGYVVGEDELAVVGSLPAAISASFDKARGILSLVAVSGQTPSQTDWRDALRAVAYRNLNSSATPAKPPTAGERELVITSGELPALFINNQAHFYRLESGPAPGTDSNTWIRARNAASTSTYGNLSGYLATSTSADENAFITRALLPSVGRTWLGGSDAGTEGKWSWDAGSASPESSTAIFSQTLSSSLTSKALGSLYVNWETNQGTAKDEDQLSIASNGLWADEDAANFSTKDYSYLIEYSPTTGTPDSTRRLLVRPLPAPTDQAFTVLDYASQAVQGSTYTLTNASLELSLFGGEKLAIQAKSVAISDGKITSLTGSATAASLYGLKDVTLTAITINGANRSITGKAKIGDQEINLSGNLKLESNGRYSFADLTGSISNEALTKLLPEGGYLSQASGGGYSFRKDAAGAALELVVKGVASFDPRPDVTDVSTPFTVRMSNGVFSNGKLSAMDLQRQGTAPWKLMLADQELTVNSETITYKRDQQPPSLNSNTPTLVKHLYNLDLAGDLKQTEGDILKLDGVLTLGSAVSGSAAPVQQPIAASFDILNNQIFRVGDTRLKANGGLKLNYQEDTSRRFGMLALAGDAKIDVEILKDLDIKLGAGDQSMAVLLNDQASNLMATEWTMGAGAISAIPTTSRRDLGLFSYENVSLAPGEIQPLIYEGGSAQDPVLSTKQRDLINALNFSLGLYRIANLGSNVITDTFTLKGVDGRPVAAVTVDIISSESVGNPELKRLQTLNLTDKKSLYDWMEAQKGNVEDFSALWSDAYATKNQADKILEVNDWFKSETIATDKGSIAVKSNGEWVYTLNAATADRLAGKYVIQPRVSAGVNLLAIVNKPSLDLKTLLLGAGQYAKQSLVANQSTINFLNGLEYEIPLTKSDAFNSVLLKLFESTPYNAYRDGKLQVVEIIDTLLYGIIKYMAATKQWKVKGMDFTPYIPLTPGLKALSYWVRTSTAIVKITQSDKTGPELSKFIINSGLFRGSQNPDPWNPERVALSLSYNPAEPTASDDWLRQSIAFTGNLDEAFTESATKLLTNPGSLSRSWDRSNSTSKTNPVDNDNGSKPRKHPFEKGKTGVSAGGSFGFNVDFTFPALYDPDRFFLNFIAADQVVLNTFDLDLSIGLDASVRFQIFPLIAILLGLNVSFEWALNWVSMLTQDEINTLGDNILRIEANANLSVAEKNSEVVSLLNAKFNQSYTDLSKEKFQITITPSLGLELGIPLLNITGKIALSSIFKYTKERWVDGFKSPNQIVNLNDYEGNPATKRYNYTPKLESLTFNLEHVYDFLLKQGPSDKTGYETFKQAYSENSWLFNIYIDPINLRSLIGTSKLSYDISLLKKLGDADISKIAWVNFIDPSVVTSGGIDFLFKEAKQLNSGISKAFRSALQKQYPKLTEKEVSRLLTLIIDNGVPTKVDYALADSQNISGRIEEMKRTYTITGSRGLNENAVLDTDRFRYRFDTADAQNAVDNYSYYSLATPKTVSINPKLDNYNYISVEFDVISTASQLDAEVQFFDGTSWQRLGRVNDTLLSNSDEKNSRGAIAFDTTAPSIDLRFIENKDAKVSADKSKYVHNSGVLSLRLSLAHMDGAASTPLEQALLDRAKSGKLQLRLQDTTTSGAANDTTFIGEPRILRGGAIYSKSSDPSTALRQDKPLNWLSHLDSGTVAWLAPTFFRPLSDRSDLAGLAGSASQRRDVIAARLNPDLPVSVHMGVQRFQMASTDHISNVQSGALAEGVQGSVRFTKDPISEITYKSYIGSDRRVRVAARLADSSDWVDIATIDNDSTTTGNLNLSASETTAPDLVAVNEELMLASWDSAGHLLTFTLTKSADTQRYSVKGSTVDAVTLDRQISSGSEATNRLSSSDQDNRFTNANLRIGLEKRLDLLSATSLQQAFYVSVLDPVEQVYGTSAKPLSLAISDYDAVASTDSLGNLGESWISKDVSQTLLKSQLKSLLGFGEYSGSGTFSPTGIATTGEVGTIKAADFMEYPSADSLSKHLLEWGSGSVFVAAANSNGEAMLWNYDGEGYYAKNRNRSAKEITASSGRVYSVNGLIPSSLSVVYKPLDQKDSLASNWQGLVDEKTAPYQQVANQPIRTATNPGSDNLIAGANVSILAVGTAQDFASYHQAAGTAAAIGALDANAYQYKDGDLIARYISPQRFTGSDGVNYWYDASNVAPLKVETLTAETADPLRKATAALNTLGNAGGLGWVWTPANQNSNKTLTELNLTTGLDFLDTSSLNLALTSQAALGPADQSLKLVPNSLQLLPTDLTPELFMDLSDGTKVLDRVSAKASSLSEMGVVLTGSELLNPSRLSTDQKLTSFEVIRSQFDGRRPFLMRGDYVPFGVFHQDGKLFYGNINAPVEITQSSLDIESLFKTSRTNYAVVPLGFEGTIADLVTYGVDQGSGDEIQKLISRMPTVVPENYFKFADYSGATVDIGDVIHVPMVPLRNPGSNQVSNKQLIFPDLTPWTAAETNQLYVAGSTPIDVTLGRGEPDPVILEKLNMYSTYNQGNQTLEEFVSYAWKDPQLKFDLLDKAYPVSSFDSPMKWLAEFGTRYGGFNLPTGYSFIAGDSPDLVNRTLFTPISVNADTGVNLDLSGKPPASNDIIRRKWTYETALTLSAELTALIFTIPIISKTWSLHKPVVWWKDSYGSRRTVSGGPLVGSFDVYIDEDRDLIRDSAEAYSSGPSQSVTLDLSGAAERLLLDTSAISNTVWDGANYVVRYQDNRLDYRSGLLISKPTTAGAVVDVMTGLASRTTYISRIEKTVVDTHWETIKNSPLLDYIPYGFKNVATISTGRWFSDRLALTKLVPEEIASVFTQTFLLPTGLDADLSNPTNIYQGFIAAASAPQLNLLAQYKFETQMMVLSSLIRELYGKLKVNRSQLSTSNAAAGYDPDIYANQVIPYLAFTLAGKTHSDYKKLVELLCDSIGGSRAAQIKAGLAKPGTVKLDFSQPADIALVLGFAQTTLPQTDFFASDWSEGRLKLTASNSIKTALQQMRLLEVGTTLSQYLKAWDTIATSQYAANSLLVTTAVSEIKREILKDGGVLSKAVDGIINKKSAGISAPTAWQTFKPLDPSTFVIRNQQIQAEASLSKVTPGVAGLAKAQVVNQVFGDSDSGVYEFTLRLSRPAPNGGAVLLLAYEGSAIYGTDYTINDLPSRPQYLYVPSGEITQKVKIDTSKSKNPSSLLLRLASSSADYSISNAFNRMLFEIGNGKATIFEQKDNVRLLSGAKDQLTPAGETIFAVLPADTATQPQPVLVGSQPSLTESYVNISTYASILYPDIVRYSATIPQDSEITGGWTLLAKDLFRAYADNYGAVDVEELKNSSTGIYTYTSDQARIAQLASQGWVKNGVAFSLDYDRSLPLAIKTARGAAPVGTVPGMSLAGITGYLDTYTFAPNQDISEWRFVASAKNLSLKNLFSSAVTLNGDLMLRKRHEYTTDTFWLSAAASGFVLPSLATGPAAKANTAAGQLDLRISQESGKAATVDQWRIQTTVSDYQFTNSLKLSGALDLAYERSVSTNYKSRYALAASVKNFSFSDGGINLANLDVNVKKLILEDGQLMNLNLDASVSDLQIAGQFKASGKLSVDYSKTVKSTTLAGNAELSSFSLGLGGAAVLSVGKGNIDFSVINGDLASASLSITLAQITANQFFNIQLASGSIDLKRENGSLISLEAKATVANSVVGPISIAAADLSLRYDRIAAVTVKNGAPLPARDETSIAVSNFSGSLSLLSPPSQATPGSTMGVLTITNGSANLNIIDGQLSSYDLKTGDVSLQLGDGINLSGSLSLKKETLKENNQNVDKLYLAMYATSLAIDVSGFKLNGSGEVEATISNQQLSSLLIDADIDQMSYAGFQLGGFAKLQLNDTDNNGSLETVKLSAGIDDFKINLPGNSSNASIYGEMQDLVVVNGDVQSWTLIGGINDFGIAGLFTANGFASIKYSKTISNSIVKESFSGSLGIRNFSLSLPGNDPGESSIGSASGLLDFDWYDNALHQWKLSASVVDLKITKDIKISGSVSLEYRDSSYSTNTYGKNLFLLDATLKEAEIRLKAGQDPLKLSGGLKNLAVTDDGVIHSWNLSASVKDLNLFNGFVISGSLNLDYQRALAGDTTTETYKGVAEISSFNLPMAGLSTDPGSSLSGKLSFVSVDDELQSWTLSARASNLKILDTFELNGEIEISTSLTTNPHNHTVKAAIQGLTINVANKFSAKMAGQLNLSYKTIDGSIYAVEEEWTLKATTLELRIPNTLNSAGGDLFAVKGQAEVYRKKNETDDDFKVTAKVDQFSLMLPGNSNAPAINLSGEISASFDNGDLKTLKINSKVQNLKIKDFSLDGAFELSYQSALLTAYTPGEDVYMVHAEYNQLKLQAPGGLANSLNLGSGSVSLTYGSLSGITAWDLRAKITNLKLFNAVTFSGSSGISYIKKIERIDSIDIPREIFEFDATVTDFTLHALNTQSLKLAGSFKMRSVDGTMDAWSLAASASGLQIMGLSLSGQFAIDYSRQDKTYFDAETIRLSRASINLSGSISSLLQNAQAGLTISDVLISRHPRTGNEFTTIQWKAEASLSISGPDLPFSLKANIDVDYLKFNPAYNNGGTYTVSGGINEFTLQTNLVTLKNARLGIRNLTILEDATDPIQSISVEGFIEELNILNILKLSGEFLINYVNDTRKSVSITGSLTDLSIAGFDIFNTLGLDSGSVSIQYAGDSSLSADFTIKLAPNSNLRLGEFNLGLGGSDLTLTYKKSAGNGSGSLGLAGNGRMTLGSTAIVVEGGFAASINLDTGTPSLDSLSLNLTPGNTPVSFGILELEAPTSILYTKNDKNEGVITLSADPRINQRFFNQIASPIYNVIDTLSPVLQPAVDFLTYEIPNDISTKEVSITIPALKIPSLEFKGWRTGLFGIKFPQFDTVWTEITPEIKTVLAPGIDIGTPLTDLLEEYPGNPFKDDEIQVIEIIDGIGAVAFKTAQKLAQIFLGDALEPYIGAFGDLAYTMDYPAISPMVGVIKDLLTLAAEGKKTAGNEWLDLPRFDVNYNINTNDLSVTGSGGDQNPYANIINNIGAIGSLYKTINRNNPIPSGPPAPKEETGASSQLGFANDSSMRVPIFENPIKSILDFVLDKPLDLFEFNLDVTGSVAARASVDFSPYIAAAIGVPIPLILGGNVSLSANLDATVGFTASPKAVKDIATSVYNIFTNNGSPKDLFDAIVTGVTEPNRGVYLDISRDILTLRPSASVDLSLDWKAVGVRAQIGLATTLSAALKLISQQPKVINIVPYDADTNSEGSSPTAEVASKAFDGNTKSKYLNFGAQNSGFRFQLDKPANFKSFTIVTANDAPSRDPASVTIRAKNADSGSWVTLLSNQRIDLPQGRNSESSAISFENTDYYTQYEVTFPTLRADSSTSMQIAEFKFTPKMNSQAAAQNRLYLTNLIMPLFDPNFKNGKQANDLYLSIKPGATTLWLDFLAKVASPWFSILRLEAGTEGFAIKVLGMKVGQTPPLPLPKISFDIPLGVVYTGPTFGPTSVMFGHQIVTDAAVADAHILTDFRSGFADQKGLFDRIANELASDQPHGFLTVATSEYSRDVLTSIPRSLLLFDYVSQQDSSPDALNVITSLDSTSGLLTAHATTTTPPLTTSILEKIANYTDMFSGSQSSYALLGGSTSAEQEQGRDKLIFEYRLQTVLLAIQDQLRSSNGMTSATLTLNGLDDQLPARDELWPYILLHQYLASLKDSTKLDFVDTESLRGLFTWIESSLATTGSTAGSVAAGLLAEFVRNLCVNIGDIAYQAEAVEGSALLAPIALSGLKQVIQSHALEGYIRNLRTFSGSDAQLKQLLEQLKTSFASLLLLPRSSATPDRFTQIGWNVDNDNNISLRLANAGNQLGAFVNLWIDTTLTYGKDYKIKGYATQPLQLVVAPEDDHLDIQIEVLNSSLNDAKLDLRLLASPAGIEIDTSKRVLQILINSTATSAAVIDNDTEALPANAVSVIQPDTIGLFTLTSASATPYLLSGFDSMKGHRIKSEVDTISSEDLQIINGLLYCGTKAIGAVIASTISGSNLLSYDNQLTPISSPDPDAGALWQAAPRSIQEDETALLELSTLLASLPLSSQAQIIHVASSARVQAALNHNSQIRVIPEPDYYGSASLILSIADAGKLNTLVVPLNVVGSVDGARLLQPIELEMNEDSELTVPEAMLVGSVVDRDRFGEVSIDDLISSASNQVALTVSRDPVNKTITIKPTADKHGTFSLDLKVQTSSGLASLEKAVSLKVNPVDDLPEARGFCLVDLSNRRFVRIRDIVKPGGNSELVTDRTLGLLDGDGDSISGIRITSYPVAGELRWQATPPANLDELGDSTTAFDIINHGIITLEDLDKGRLVYIPDSTSPSANRLSDSLCFVIAQERDGKTIQSSSFTLSIGDDLSDDDAAVRPVIMSSSIDYSKQTDLATIQLTFDQPLSLEGGQMYLWLRDPAKPELLPRFLHAVSLNPSQLSDDRKVLTLVDVAVPKDIEGVISFDLFSRADVLRNDYGISLGADPQQLSLIVDTLPLRLLSHSFSVKESAILLDLEFSNPVLSTGNARLSYFNPITGITSEITSLRPSTTPIREGQAAYASSTVTFEFGSLVNNLTVIPGQTYQLQLDSDTGLKDPGDNGADSAVLSLDLKIPYPKTPAFAAAEANDKGTAVSPTTFYFTVQNGVTEKEQVPIVTPTARLPKGVQVQAAGYNSSRLFFKLETAGVYDLAINIVGQNAQEIAVHELEILFPRKELWFDPNLLEKIADIKSFSLDRDPVNDSFGILRLRLSGSGKLDPGSSELLNIPFRTFPLTNGANQRDTAPPIILRKVVGIQSGAAIKTSELNLPQLLLNKDNLALATEPLVALGDRTLTINANSAGEAVDLIIRSLRGLKSGGAISLVSAPAKGAVTIDQAKEIWIYKPHENEVGEDKFSLRVVDAEGNQIDHNVVITIRPNAVKHAVITAEDEKQLAARLSPNASGDSNGDNKPDVEQGNIALLPWRTINNFIDPDNASTSSLIRLLVPKDSAQATATGEALTTPNLNDSWEFSQIEVLSLADPSFGGGVPAGVVGSWDPLSFSLSTVAGAANSTAQTVRVWIDLSSGQYPSSYFNSYRKFVSDSAIQDYIAAGLPLKDLDGGAITKPGWYDFMQRTDANGNPVGDGARMIVKNGVVQGIELNLRDNSFGDSDPSVGVIKDPGSLGLVPRIRLNPGQLSSALNTATTAHGLPELQFIASPGLASQFRVFAPGASVGTSGLISGTSLVAGQQFRVEEITVDADRSAYVLRFLDANPSRSGNQVFGSHFQGLPTGNVAAVADGVYRISLADNVQLGSFNLATQLLAPAQQLRLARFNTLAVQKNNYYYFSPLHGYRNAATPGDGDDLLLGKPVANVGASRELLSGMGGNDFLNGYGNRFDPSLDFNSTTNPLAAFGRNQRDVLTGGAGRDVFQLADAIGVFYRGDAAQGFAQITDFSAEDVLILSGSPAQYTLTAPLTALQSPVGIAGRALYAGDPKTGGDLIAVLQGVGSAAFQLGSTANPSSQVHWL